MKKRLFKTESIISKKQQQGFEKGTLYKVKFPKEAEQFHFQHQNLHLIKI